MLRGLGIQYRYVEPKGFPMSSFILGTAHILCRYLVLAFREFRTLWELRGFTVERCLHASSRRDHSGPCLTARFAWNL